MTDQQETQETREETLRRLTEALQQPQFGRLMNRILDLAAPQPAAARLAAAEICGSCCLLLGGG